MLASCAAGLVSVIGRHGIGRPNCEPAIRTCATSAREVGACPQRANSVQERQSMAYKLFIRKER